MEPKDGSHHDVGSLQGCLRVPQCPLSCCIHGPKAALQHNNRVIYHHADTEDQTAHGNDVQRKSRPRHNDQGHQDGGRDRASDDQGCLKNLRKTGK